MGHVAKVPPLISPEAYLDGEKSADVRGEYVDGFVYAMSGVSEAHNDIAINLTSWLRSRLPPGCSVFGGQVKLKASETRYYYPDVFVSCGPRQPTDHVRRTARLVVEILSPSTERTDRGEKFEAYTSMPEIEEYILVAQDRLRVEVYRRRTGWAQEIFAEADVIDLASINGALAVREIYRDIPL
jgi:Uma2 family endonuclease